jgi:hypothetical protein
MLAVEQRAFGRRRQADLGPQTVPGLGPGADTPFGAPEQETVKGRAEKTKFRQELGLRHHGRIVNREEAEGLK